MPTYPEHARQKGQRLRIRTMADEAIVNVLRGHQVAFRVFMADLREEIACAGLEQATMVELFGQIERFLAAFEELVNRASRVRRKG